MHDVPLSYLFAVLLIGAVSPPISALTNPEIDTMIAEMTIEEKVGQLIMVGFEGTQANETIETHIRERFVGGVVLFARNIESPRQTAELTNELQQLASATTHQVPLFIGIDQEGGWVIRLREGATVLPGNMALGATNSTGVGRARRRDHRCRTGRGGGQPQLCAGHRCQQQSGTIPLSIAVPSVNRRNLFPVWESLISGGCNAKVCLATAKAFPRTRRHHR